MVFAMRKRDEIGLFGLKKSQGDIDFIENRGIMSRLI
jgi:hypothetical protein